MNTTIEQASPTLERIGNWGQRNEPVIGATIYSEPQTSQWFDLPTRSPSLRTGIYLGKNWVAIVEGQGTDDNAALVGWSDEQNREPTRIGAEGSPLEPSFHKARHAGVYPQQ